MTSVIASKGTRWLAALVASALVLALMIGSDQRSAQAIGPGETDIAYVADGYNFPDALMGATLAALNAAPMLGVRSPTTGDVVPPETADELDRLTNDKANPLATIYVFGGPAAVSDKVVGDLEAWADDVQRIFGDNRFGTMEAISQMLPTKAKDSDLLDGMDSTDFLASDGKADDSELLDGMDSSAFLADSDELEVQSSNWFSGDATFTPNGGFVTASAAGGAYISDFGDVPLAIGENRYSASSVEICFNASSAPISQLEFAVVDEAGNIDGLESDSTGWNTTECATMTFDTPVVLTAGRVPLLGVTFDGSGGDLAIFSTVYTLVQSQSGHIASSASAATAQSHQDSRLGRN